MTACVIAADAHDAEHVMVHCCYLGHGGGEKLPKDERDKNSAAAIADRMSGKGKVLAFPGGIVIIYGAGQDPCEPDPKDSDKPLRDKKGKPVRAKPVEVPPQERK